MLVLRKARKTEGCFLCWLPGDGVAFFRAQVWGVAAMGVSDFPNAESELDTLDN